MGAAVTDTSPVLCWFRRGDLRLADNPALSAAAESGRPVIPVFLRDECVGQLGAAACWRLERSLEALAADLARCGSRLILRTGQAGAALATVAEETGAGGVYWARRYDPLAVGRDTGIKAMLKARRLEARSRPGNILFEPWTVTTRSGTPFKVFTPMWRAVRGRDVPFPRPAPSHLRAPARWPGSEALADWRLGAAMKRGATVLEQYAPEAGEAAAQRRLAAFLERDLASYPEARDRLDDDGTSGLSPFLAAGEIGIRQCWHALRWAQEAGNTGAESYLRQLVWREFAMHLLFHHPDLPARCWRPEWERFPWDADDTRPEVRAWQRGRTGVPLVDAGMRQMMVTGTMHNRARMVVASYLTKHLLADWRIGLAWFADHLIDWDAANNALGWQWVAGCGPDAAPYFRVFNPESQAEKFDPTGRYRRAWIAEGPGAAPQSALAFFAAAPRSWGLSRDDGPAAPAVGLAAGRRRALAAYQRFRDDAG